MNQPPSHILYAYLYNAVSARKGACPGCRRWLAGLWLAMAVVSSPAQAATTPFATAATVGESIITRYEVDQQLALLAFLSNTKPTPELTGQALRTLVDARLVEMAAREHRLPANQEDLDIWMATIARTRQVTPPALLQQLQSANIATETVRAWGRTDIYRQQLAQRLFGSQVVSEIDPADLAAAIATYENDQPIEYHLFEIDFGNLRDASRIANLVKEIRTQLREGKSFQELARLLSSSTSAKNGGNRGWWNAQLLGTALAKIVAQIPPGDISPPLSEFGESTIVLYVAERRVRPRSGVVPWTYDFEENFLAIPDDATEAKREAAFANVLAVHKQTRACRQALPENARIARQLFKARRASDLSLGVSSVLEGLKEGEVSRVALRPNRASFLVLCERLGGLSSLYRQRITIAEAFQMRQARIEQLWITFLTDLRKRTPIEILDQ